MLLLYYRRQLFINMIVTEPCRRENLYLSEAYTEHTVCQ